MAKGCEDVTSATLSEFARSKVECRPEAVPRISEVMARLLVSRATLYRMVAAGKLRLVKTGASGCRHRREHRRMDLGRRDAAGTHPYRVRRG